MNKSNSFQEQISLSHDVTYPGMLLLLCAAHTVFVFSYLYTVHSTLNDYIVGVCLYIVCNHLKCWDCNVNR